MDFRLSGRSTVRGATLALGLGACVGLAACGESGASTSSSASLGGPGGGKLTSADIALAHKFVGGRLGKATKSPINVGVITINGGPIPAPPGKNVIEAARRLINDELDGVDGHPLTFTRCATGISDEQSQACGQKFASDPSIKAVLNPGQPSGGLSLLGAMGGKKAEFCVIPTQPELLGTNVFCPGGGVVAASSTIPYLQSATPKLDKVSWVLPDDPLFRQFASGEFRQMKKAGLHPTLGYVPQNSPDVTSGLVASGVRKASAIQLTLVSAGQCIAVAKALKTLGVPASVPIVSLPTCVDPAVKKALGDIPRWTYFDMAESPYLPQPSPPVKLFLDANRTYTDGATGAWTVATFATTLWMAKVFNKLGADNLTTKAIAAEAKAFRGPMLLMDPQIRFGQAPWGNTGTLSGRFFTYEGAGKWSDATKGKFLASPPPVN